eukprot:4052429-Prymnesium_polylepis.1
MTGARTGGGERRKENRCDETTLPAHTFGSALLASVKSPLLRVGLHFLPRTTLVFCVDVVPAPRYRPARGQRR